MSEKRYIVQLTEDERARLTAIVHSKRVARKKRMRAQVLRKIDAGEHGPAWTDERAAAAFDVHVNTVLYNPQATRPARLRRGPGTQDAGRASPHAGLRPRDGSGTVHRRRQRPADGPCALDAASAGRRRRATGHRRVGLP